MMIVLRAALTSKRFSFQKGALIAPSSELEQPRQPLKFLIHTSIPSFFVKSATFVSFDFGNGHRV